ncbi:MAG: hypothetical protein COB12_02340 [Flavobacterium sp.]|nr:MAG: hypothetical protein COB12_02340 [Flavobacterium sp.]
MKCEEAGHVCDKNQYKEANFMERVRLTIHLIYCSACRKYSFNNNKLTKALRKSNIKTISETDKNALKEQFQKEMNK